MTVLFVTLSTAIVAMPLLASGAEAGSETASQISAAGFGRRPIITNRPSWGIDRRNRFAGNPFGRPLSRDGVQRGYGR